MHGMWHTISVVMHRSENVLMIDVLTI